MRKRSLLAGCLAAAMSLTLIACGSSGGTQESVDTPAVSAESEADQAEGAGEAEAVQETAGEEKTGSGDVVELEWLHIWPEYDDIWKEAVADFEAQHENIKINTIAISWDKLSNSLLTYFAGGDAPDVMPTWSTGRYQAMGAIMDLTPYLEADNGAWKNTFGGAGLGVGKVGDSYYSVPLRTTATLMIYNKTMMDEHGWKEPATQEEFEALMEEIKAAGITPLVCPGNPEGYQIAVIGNNFAEHKLYANGKLEDPEYRSGHMSDIGEEYTYAAEKLRKWYDNGWIDANATGMTRDEAGQAFYTQKGVFYFSNNNEYANHAQAAAEAGFELGAMAMPAPEGTPVIINNFGADSWMVSAKTEHPDECIEWLKYLSSDEFMQNFADKTSSVVGNASVTYSDAAMQKFADIFSGTQCYRINADYVSNDCNIDINMEMINYLLDPAYTPEKLGEYAANAWAENIAENAG